MREAEGSLRREGSQRLPRPPDLRSHVLGQGEGARLPVWETTVHPWRTCQFPVGILGTLTTPGRAPGEQAREGRKAETATRTALGNAPQSLACQAPAPWKGRGGAGPSVAGRPT